MPREQPTNRLVSAYLTVREWLPTIPALAREWVEQIRREPALFWQSTVFKAAAWGGGALVGLLLISWGVGLIQPEVKDAKPQARTADFYVICQNPSCGRTYVINRKFGFDDFPVECPHCAKQTGAQALRCYSSQCRGRFVVPKAAKEGLYCPQCERKLRDE